ncbi:MAG: OmpA family protein [Bacteroidota bacterium]|nr:OmpA family protein [Bacteroidota bacterium]
MKKAVIISFLLCSTLCWGQIDYHTKKKKLVEQYQQAEELVRVGNLFKSAEILNEVLNKDPGFDEAIVLLHEVLLKRDEPQRAVVLIAAKREELEAAYLNRLLLFQANYAYQLGEYTQAQQYITQLGHEVYGVGAEQVEFLKTSIQFSLEQVADPMPLTFEELPHPINAFEQQYFPSITRQGQLVFTTRDNNGRGDENIFFSQLTERGWTKPANISDQINTDRNEGTASISADGRTLVFTSCNRPDNIGSCDLYVSYKQGQQWSAPELLNERVNSPEWDSQPSLTADGATLYFVSLRPGGMGKQDIWMSRKEDGEWQQAVNLGEDVNTPEDDCSPFIYLDGQTLIFSTKGRVGLGGYDLFKTLRLADAKWSVPENLGYPINDAFDQVGYCVSADLWAYFSASDASGSLRLKRFKIPENVLPQVETPRAFGRVIDARDERPLQAKVELLNNSGLIELETEGGVFELQKANQVKAKKTGYRTQLVEWSEFITDSTIRMEPFAVGQALLNEPILFDFDSFELKPGVSSQLMSVLELLKAHPELDIEVQGHTDSIGGHAYNQQLSEKRALAVAAWLQAHGIGHNRVFISSFGKKRPISPEVDPQSQQNNRRVEIIIRTVRK